MEGERMEPVGRRNGRWRRGGRGRWRGARQKAEPWAEEERVRGKGDPQVDHESMTMAGTLLLGLRLCRLLFRR